MDLNLFIMGNSRKISSKFGLVLIIVVSLCLTCCFSGVNSNGGPLVYGGRYNYGYNHLDLILIITVGLNIVIMTEEAVIMISTTVSLKILQIVFVPPAKVVVTEVK